MCLKSMRCRPTHQKEANSISMDLLMINSRNTQAQGTSGSRAWHGVPPASPYQLLCLAFPAPSWTPTLHLPHHSAPVLTPGPLISCGEEQGCGLGIFEGPEAQSWQVLSCQGPAWTLIHESAAFLWLLMKLSVPTVLAYWSFPACLLFTH